MIKNTSIRLRLTLWYGALLGAILIAFSASVYVLMQHHLMALTDAGLSEELMEFADDVARGSSPETLGPRYGEHEGYEMQVSTPDGRVLFHGDRLGPEGFPVARGDRASAQTTFTALSVGGLGRVRIASRIIVSPFGPLVIKAAISLAPVANAMRELLMVLLLAGPASVAVSLGVGYLLARKALAPVDRMVAEAALITGARLDRRLEVLCPGDELGRLAATLNDMIERLEHSFLHVRRFTADAAHELRTPLAVIRCGVEVALRERRSPERDQSVLEDVLVEVERLGRTVTQLLDLCREDDCAPTMCDRSVRLDEVARDVIDLMQVAASDKGVRLSTDGLEPCRVRGDEDRLRQLLINLIDNAIKYTPVGGSVTVRGTTVDRRAKIEVSDTGIGISAEHLPRLFERFYRADASRSHEIEGAGLGLAICRSIVEAHHGEVLIESKPAHGTKVAFILPREDSPLRIPPERLDFRLESLGGRDGSFA